VVVLENEKWKGLLDKILKSHRTREMEYRLFKKCVRRFVSKETFRLISDEYNREVTRQRIRKYNDK
jgi:hypothetical protein